MKTSLIITVGAAFIALTLSGVGSTPVDSASTGAKQPVEPVTIKLLDTRAVQPRYMFEVQR